jgi:murein L,D-transpeptidase YafK
LKTYQVCTKSGELGPKRRLGDSQVPEGFYHIDRFNPWSSFHLSLGVNYPNKSDRLLGDKKNPGGDIFIHGSCVTIGCLPITDEHIEELYIIALDAYKTSSRLVQVHIFPARLKGENMEFLRKFAVDHGIDFAFWENLKKGYDYFEEKKQLPRIEIDGQGKYLFR